MKNIIIGFILGLALALPVSALAYGHDFSNFETRVIELLEELVYHGEDISSDTQTLIDRVSDLPRG